MDTKIRRDRKTWSAEHMRIDTLGEHWFFVPDAGLGDGWVAVPAAVSVVGSFDGLKVEAQLGFDPVADLFGMESVRIASVDDAGVPLDLIFRCLADLPAVVLSEVARVAMPVSDTMEFRTTSGRVDVESVASLVEGRPKSQDMRRQRKLAPRLLRQVKSERDQWPDVYAEAARRMHVSRSTFYRHLRAARSMPAREDSFA